MKKKFNVIQINGLTGIFLILFILGCAVAGFVLFPSWCCMSGWNFLAKIFNFPLMNIYHGVFLWFIICLSLFAAYHGRSPLKFGCVTSTAPQDLKDTLKKMQEKNFNSVNVRSEEKFKNSAQISPFVNVKFLLNNNETEQKNEEDSTIKKEN